MASVRWTVQALDSLLRLDLWRADNDWDLIGSEIQEAVAQAFSRFEPTEPPHYLPGKQIRIEGQPTGVRLWFVTVRSKSFKVFYTYESGQFRIGKVVHPRALDY